MYRDIYIAICDLCQELDLACLQVVGEWSDRARNILQQCVRFRTARDRARSFECDAVFINLRVVIFSNDLPVIAHDQYRVAFDLHQKGYEWLFPAFGLIFVAIGAVLVCLGRAMNWQRSRRLVGYFMIGFACLWSGVTFLTTFREYTALRSAYRRSQFSVIEGHVTNFRPMPYQGHQDECFSVQSQTFCYSDYVVTPGFNNSASHGGPIREGLPVRISYVGNAIVRLEVESDTLP
jgi:hypothetical protein